MPVRRGGWVAAVPLLWAVVVAPVSRSQEPPQIAELPGTIFETKPQQGLLRFRNSDGGTPWHPSADWVVLAVPGKTAIRVTGTADREILCPGLFVRLTGELDDKGVIQGEINALELVSAASNMQGGMFEPGADGTGKPVAKLKAGTFEIRGKLTKIKDGQLTINAKKKISGKLAKDATLTVNSTDLSLIGPDSPATIKGAYLKSEMPDADSGRLGKFVATEVSVEMTRPLKLPAGG